jgi:hypothetical protein
VTVSVSKDKSPGLAAFLGCAFGALGLLYLSARTAAWAFLVGTVLILVTAGAALIPFCIGCGVFGWMAATAHNRSRANVQTDAPHNARTPAVVKHVAPQPLFVPTSPAPTAPVRVYPTAGTYSPLERQVNGMAAVKQAVFCSNCGSRAGTSASFCAACGTKLAA